MTARSPILLVPKRLLIWFPLNCCSYSLASAAHVEAPSEVDRDSTASAEYTSVIQALKGRLRPDKLIHVLESMPDATSALKVFKWASTQRRFQQTADTYAQMILKLGMLGDHEGMDILLNEVVRLQLQGTEQAFDFLIHSFCTSYRPVEALQVFQCSVLAKHQFSLSTYNILLAAFASQSANFLSLMFIYKEMVKAGILPDVGTLNHLIKGLCEVGRLDLALNQFHRMGVKRCAPNSQTFEILIDALHTSGRSDEAVTLLNQMLELRCTPHPDFYRNIIPFLCSINRYEEGIKLLRTRAGVKGELDLYLYDNLIQCLSNNQQVESAIELFQEIKESGIGTLSSMHTNIVDALCKIEKFSEAMSFLDEEHSLQIEPCNCLLKGLCTAGRILEATNYLKKMAQSGLTNFLSWSTLVKGLCKEGLVRQAFEVIGRMIVSSYMPEGTIYSALITGYSKIREDENALVMFRVSVVCDYSLDSESCSHLIECLCAEKKIQEAAEVFHHIISQGCLLSSKALNGLVQGICHDGKVHEAIQICSLAVSNGTSCNAATDSIILLGLLRLDKAKNALAFLSKMLVDGCTLDATTYCILIHGLCSKDMTKQAADLFNQMVRDGFLPNADALESLICRLAGNSQLHMVLHTLDNLINDLEFLSPSTCNAIIYNLVKVGHEHVARKFLDRMLDKGWVPDVHTHVLLVRNNKVEETNGNDDVLDASDDDKVSQILAEGLDNF